MFKFVRAIFILFTFFCCGFLGAKDIKSNEYFVYVKEIVNSFVAEIEDKHGLKCVGSGGAMPCDVEKIEVLFNSKNKVNIEQARFIEIDCIEKLLGRINSHEKIRPFLREYPFKADRVNISLSFSDENNRSFLDGSIVHVFLAKKTIYYNAAELRKCLFYSSIKDGDSSAEPIEIVDEALVPLFEESYEDAVRIVAEAKVNGVDAVASFKKASQPESKCIQPESSSSSYHKALSEYIRHLDKEIGFHGKGQHRQSR